MNQVFDDAVMVHVHFKEQILAEFEQAIASAVRRGWVIGPQPTRWALVGYLPEWPLPSLH